MTDSGGLQEETTFLGVPCLTLRNNTERPITISVGTNQLVKLAKEDIISKVKDILNGKIKKGSIPPLWDGATASRIVGLLNNLYG
jgi:UDP-N-acetylglucosamine 2-epimerase (non-hydrolysing)